MSDAQLAEARNEFSRLRPGMTSAKVLDIVGKPDATDKQNDNSGALHSRAPSLLGICSVNHNENLAYVYFMERWTDEIRRRDPLHDRYVILFFSANRKFTHMFSNVASIPPIFPQNRNSWMRLMWGDQALKP